MEDGGVGVVITQIPLPDHIKVHIEALIGLVVFVFWAVDARQWADEDKQDREADAQDLEMTLQHLVENDYKILNALELKQQEYLEAMEALQKNLAEHVDRSLERIFMERALTCLRRASQTTVTNNQQIYDWVITSWEIEINDPISRGGFGEVSKATWLGHTQVAVKHLLIRLDTNRLREDFHREVKIWYPLRHPHILELLGACATAERPFMVSPFMDNGHALQYLDKCLDDPVKPVQLMYEISQGMHYLHSRHVIHGDLKAINVLVDKHGKAMVADFGFATLKKITSTRQTSATSGSSGSVAGTLRWMAPERLQGGQLTQAVDVYAFAMTCYELITGGDIPLTDVPDALIYQSVVHNNIRPVKPDSCPKPLWDLMCSCWHPDPLQRPTFASISLSMRNIVRDVENQQMRLKNSMIPSSVDKNSASTRNDSTPVPTYSTTSPSYSPSVPSYSPTSPSYSPAVPSTPPYVANNNTNGGLRTAGGIRGGPSPVGGANNNNNNNNRFLFGGNNNGSVAGSIGGSTTGGMDSGFGSGVSGNGNDFSEVGVGGGNGQRRHRRKHGRGHRGHGSSSENSGSDAVSTPPGSVRLDFDSSTARNAPAIPSDPNFKLPFEPGTWGAWVTNMTAALPLSLQADVQRKMATLGHSLNEGSIRIEGPGPIEDFARELQRAVSVSGVSVGPNNGSLSTRNGSNASLSDSNREGGGDDDEGVGDDDEFDDDEDIDDDVDDSEVEDGEAKNEGEGNDPDKEQAKKSALEALAIVREMVNPKKTISKKTSQKLQMLRERTDDLASRQEAHIAMQEYQMKLQDVTIRQQDTARRLQELNAREQQLKIGPNGGDVDSALSEIQAAKRDIALEQQNLAAEYSHHKSILENFRAMWISSNPSMASTPSPRMPQSTTPGTSSSASTNPSSTTSTSTWWGIMSGLTGAKPSPAVPATPAAPAAPAPPPPAPPAPQSPFFPSPLFRQLSLTGSSSSVGSVDASSIERRIRDPEGREFWKHYWGVSTFEVTLSDFMLCLGEYYFQDVAEHTNSDGTPIDRSLPKTDLMMALLKPFSKPPNGEMVVGTVAVNNLTQYGSGSLKAGVKRVIEETGNNSGSGNTTASNSWGQASAPMLPPSFPPYKVQTPGQSS
ncbi:hypothetical protein HDU76_004415 [Blyttiomyces sp. JEL0837]|nr:hypothetical protein HDU76_004415 [Blyttiomyces sp. JEL0837]